MSRFSPLALSAAWVFLAIAIPPAVISERSVPEAAAKGKRIFAQSCASCHDAVGTATKSGPALQNYYGRQPRPADAAVRTIIEQGKGRMPGFTSLDKSQLDNLVAYIKTL